MFNGQFFLYFEHAIFEPPATTETIATTLGATTRIAATTPPTLAASYQTSK
jgi:hypothetical protein